MDEYEKEAKEHPWASPAIVRRIVADHKKAMEECKGKCPIRNSIKRRGL